jgi:hypothetical protein
MCSASTRFMSKGVNFASLSRIMTRLVEAAVMLLDPGGETDEFLLVELLGNRDDAARPRTVRMKHGTHLLGGEREPKRLLQQLHRIKAPAASAGAR